MVVGLALVAAGALIWLLGSRGGHGLLPGDVFIERGNTRFYFPVATCLVLSALLSLLFWLFRR